MQELNQIKIAERLDQLTELSVQLGSNHDTDSLLERILMVAKSMTNADGGTLYRPSDDRQHLNFHILLNDTLNIHQGGASGVPVSGGVPLYDDQGEKNLSAVAAYAAHFHLSVNIEDVYKADVFNFSGMVKFDQLRGYHSQSILTVPMSDHEGELVGVLQLINAKDPETGAIHSFSQTDQRFIEALAAQAAVALTHQRLIFQLEELLESLVNLINIGIDDKSPYTGRHCQFVPELTMMLAEAVHNTETGPLAEFRMTDADRKELWLAGLLHDCGKITTPVHVVDKATKLETIYDRIGMIDTRFEVLLRDAEIAALQRKLAAGADVAAIDAELAQQQAVLRAERDFIRTANIGGEGMRPEDQERVRAIGKRRWTGPDGVERDFFNDDELLNLTIKFGTLTDAERKEINNHIVMTIKMLEALPWPKHLKNVPEYAGGHHERMDGKGYPRGLTKDQMSVQARVMAIADIFEALTAKDRPYKKGKMLSESLRILGNFSLNGHIDPDLFDIFIRNKIYLEFARKNMDEKQIDAIDEAKIPGYTPLMRLFPAKLGKIIAKYGWRWLLGILITALGVAYALALFSNDTVARLDNLWAGERMKLEPPTLDKRIVIVDIDGKSLTEFGRFPWSRNVQASLISQLVDHYKVAAVGYDISFPEPDTSSGYNVLEQLSRTELKDVPVLRQRLEALKPMMDYDGVFASALAGKPVILGFNLSPDQVKGALPKPLFSEADLNGRELLAYNAAGFEANVPVLTQAAAGAGSFSVVTDPDGIVRSAYLIQQVGDDYYPSLSLATASLYLKALAVKPLMTETADQLSQSQLDSGGYDALTILLPGRKQRVIPVGEAMSTVVQYRGRGGPHGGSFRYVSAADVLTGRAPAALLNGTVVLIGTTAPGLVDLRATPVNPEYPGVEIHANLIKSILDNRFKSRPYWAFVAEAGEILVVGLVLSFALAALSPLRAILLGATVLGAVVGLNYYQYSEQDLIFNLAMMVLVVISLFVVNVAWGYFFEVRKGAALVSRFGEYVAPELVAEMAEDPEKYNMDGESRELTVMFVDVRGFTTISEGLTPKQLREYINLYLTAMSEDIRSAHQGTLDKYIGDAVMAFWGAPVAFDDHASRGVATSLLMQASAQRLNQEFLARGWPELKIGIGLNSGLMHVGDMGSNIRRAYTVMGDAVNLGSRLEGITKVYGVGIAVGASTRAAAPEFTYRELDLVRVKGKHEPVAIFEPIALAQDTDAATLREVQRWHAALAAVRAQRWDEASAILAELQALSPQRGLYQLYVERIAYYRAHPPGEHWDGVTTFETK